MKNRQKVRNVIGIDLGDKKHAVCVVDKHGTILKEYSVRNQANSLSKLARAYPQSLIAMEVGTHSPWISRLFEKEGLSVLVANARKLRAIYTNERN
ncbi:transposase [bacterium]|jgi:transposase|nr:transposase [Akkermansiaceae bacterium]MDB4526823.1 transposase [bacterium]